MRPNQLENALKQLSDTISVVKAALDEMRAESDPLAVHIFVSRRHYRNLSDTKGGRRREAAARTGWQTACELGFRSSLGEWERLMDAAPRR